MIFVKQFLDIIWENSSVIFSNIELVCVFYSLVFLILFLENAIIPAFFLPGDSLLIILGVLISRGVLNFFITLSVLTVAASLGSWISYLQGKFLEKNKLVKRWCSYIPFRIYHRAYYVFHRYGLCVLLIGRFLVFIRTLLPIFAGISGLDFFRFQLFNWISSFLWVLLLIIFGVILERSVYYLIF